MDAFGLLAVCLLLAVVLGLAVAVVSVFKKTEAQLAQQPVAAQREDEDEATVAAVRRGGAADRMRAGRMRQRAAAARAAAAAQPAGRAAGWEDGEVSDSCSEGEEEGEAGGPGRRESKKERARRERQEAREAEQAAREARSAKSSAYEERRAAKEKEREARERAEAEELARQAAERQAAEDAEAAKWVGLMSVAQEGSAEAEEGAVEGSLLGAFVEYIQKAKSVPLEALAAEFGLRSSDVIERINALEAMGRLTGVLDERGKYIYISPEEMQAVAAHIVAKGRVSISELAAASNKFIDLDSKSWQQAGGAAVSRPGAPVLDFSELAAEVAADA